MNAFQFREVAFHIVGARNEIKALELVRRAVDHVRSLNPHMTDRYPIESWDDNVGFENEWAMIMAMGLKQEYLQPAPGVSEGSPKTQQENDVG